MPTGPVLPTNLMSERLIRLRCISGGWIKNLFQADNCTGEAEVGLKFKSGGLKKAVVKGETFRSRFDSEECRLTGFRSAKLVRISLRKAPRKRSRMALSTGFWYWLAVKDFMVFAISFPKLTTFGVKYFL
jgi:hypothetical protein